MGRSISTAFILLVLISATPLISSTNLSEKEAEKNDNKVVIALYYETLCPYCSNLIVNYLYKYFEDGLDSISILKLVPYGNAKIKPNNTIVCQVSFFLFSLLLYRGLILYYLFMVLWASFICWY